MTNRLRILPTASNLSRSIKCIGAAVLPHSHGPSTPEQERGTVAVHAYLEAVPEVGVQAAVASVPEKHRDMSSRIELDGLPLDPSYCREMAVGLDMVTGKAREIGRGINRNYGKRGLLEFVGTADVAWIEGDLVVVADYKGPSDNGDLKDHWQLRFLALAFARLWGKHAGIIQRYRIFEDGTHHKSEYPLDKQDMAETEARLRSLIDEWLEASQLVAAGKPLQVNPGADQCKWCPAFAACPDKVQLLQKMVKEPARIGEGMFLITEENLPEIRERYLMLKQVVGAVGSALHAFGAERTTALGNGLYFGSHEVPHRKVDAAVAYAIVRREWGQEIAEASVDMDASLASLERGVRSLQAKQQAEKAQAGAGLPAPVKIATEKRRLLALISEAGGLEVTTKVKVEEFKKAS